MEVIFLHGLGQGPSAWEGVVSALPDSIRADCPDLFALAKGGTLDYPALYRGFSAFCGKYHLKWKIRSENAAENLIDGFHCESLPFMSS